MGAFKNYLLTLEEHCSDNLFGQDAIEYAVFTGLIPLSYNLDEDVQRIVVAYDIICDCYREHRRQLNKPRKAA